MYAQLPAKFNVQFWTDEGSLEHSGNRQDWVDTLGLKGWVLNSDYTWYVGQGQGHDEAAWRARFPLALAFLYGGVLP